MVYLFYLLLLVVMYLIFVGCLSERPKEDLSRLCFLPLMPILPLLQDEQPCCNSMGARQQAATGIHQWLRGGSRRKINSDLREKIKSYFGKQEDKNNDHHRADELSALFQRVSGTDIVS